MGIRARILQVVQSKLARFQENPGQSVISQLQSNAGEVLQIEGFQPSGLVGMPPAGAKAIVLQLGDSPTQAVVIATQNYQITVSVAQGEVMLYSTTAAGTTLEATIKLGANGLIQIQNQSQNLLSALSKLIQGIQGATYIPYPGGFPGSPVPIVDTTGNIAAALAALQGLLA
jgi:phage gp45-like